MARYRDKGVKSKIINQISKTHLKDEKMFVILAKAGIHFRKTMIFLLYKWIPDWIGNDKL